MITISLYVKLYRNFPTFYSKNIKSEFKGTDTPCRAHRQRVHFEPEAHVPIDWSCLISVTNLETCIVKRVFYAARYSKHQSLERRGGRFLNCLLLTVLR